MLCSAVFGIVGICPMVRVPRTRASRTLAEDVVSHLWKRHIRIGNHDLQGQMPRRARKDLSA